MAAAAEGASAGIRIPGEDQREASQLPMSLDQRWRSGDGFYLALVDPLLSKVAYVALRKPKVTIGFLPDSDWTVPWTSMGIDLVSDSRRFDRTYASNACSPHDDEYNNEEGCLYAPEIGKREKEPMFEMSFDATSGWTAHCPSGHGCRLISGAGTADDWNDAYFIEDEYDVITEDWEGSNPSSSISPLTDGLAFEFQWPYYSLKETCKSFSLPGQRLRFVFVACKRSDAEPSANHWASTTGQRYLLSLPVEVLAMIGSYLRPQEYLRTLALVGRIFTSPKLKNQIPWTSVTLTTSFDSLRIVRLASTEFLREVKCESHWDNERKFAFYTKWELVIRHDQLRTLEIHDPHLLHGIAIPPHLAELRLRMRPMRADFWPALKMLPFPSTITRLSVRCDLFESVGSRIELQPFRLSPVWLFNAFSGLVEVHFRNVIFVTEEWADVQCKQLEKLTNVFAKPLPEEFPLARMPNLRRLQMDMGNNLGGIRLMNAGLRDVEFSLLETLVIEHGYERGLFDTQFVFVGGAPILRYLQIVSKGLALDSYVREFPTGSTKRDGTQSHVRWPFIFLEGRGCQPRLLNVMDDVFRRRVKKGDRWFLALVDPLLNKPAYVALNKREVTVGFLPGCDFVLPCASMGVDFVSDSRRLDPTYNSWMPLDEFPFHSWPIVRAIGEREKEPFFQMFFQAGEDGSRSWKVSCPAGHNCRVSRVEETREPLEFQICYAAGDDTDRTEANPESQVVNLSDGDAFSDDIDGDAFSDDTDETEANPESQVVNLSDGDAFEFIWPFRTFPSEQYERCPVYDMPAQKLRFVFIEELADEETINDRPSKWNPPSSGQRQLQSLPMHVLAKIASYLSPEEFLRTLTLVSRVFTSPAMKNSIPWASLTIYNTFDALRVAEMAAPGTACSVNCPRLWDDRQSYAVFLKWKPLIHHEAVTSMQVHDPRLFCCIGVPPNLKELQLFARKGDSLEEHWRYLKYFRLPFTVKTLSILCLDGTYRLPIALDNGQQFYFTDADWGPGDLLDPSLFASFCKHVETLHLVSIPFAECNFGLIPKQSFQQLTRLVIHDMRPSFPLEKMNKLFLLDVSLSRGVTLGMLVLPESYVFNHLRSFTMRYDEVHDGATPSELSTFLRKMPKLEYLKLVTTFFKSWLSAVEARVCPSLRILWVSRTSSDLRHVAEVLSKEIPGLDELTIVESLGKVSDVSRDSFPQGTVRWQRLRNLGRLSGSAHQGMRVLAGAREPSLLEGFIPCSGGVPRPMEEKFDFFFSRLTGTERRELMKLYCYEPLE